MIGYISDYDGEILTIKVPYTDTGLLQQQGITQAEIRLDDGRTISAQQRKKAYATIRDIAIYTGYFPEEAKEIMKYYFIAETGEKYFSLSDCSMSTAREFISYVIDFCLEWNVPCRDNLLDRCDDVSRYLYSCLKYKRCCLCGKPAEIHHAEDSRVGMGRDRHEICHVGLNAFALCRGHHTEAHAVPEAEFCAKYHIYPIKIDNTIAEVYRLNTEVK